MKMPNGYGSVYKLSGNRRKPWAARVTDGWVNDTKTKKSKQKYKFIGFYETRKEALLALADYNANPYNIDTANITFQEVYERWNAEHFPTVSESNVKGYKAAFLLCAPIAGRRFVDVKLDDLQACADNSGKNYPTLRKYKVLLGLMYKYAVIHEIIPKERNTVEYVNIKKAGIRTVPIAEKVVPFFEYWLNLNDCEYLLSTPEGEHFLYRNYYDSYWSPLMETLSMKHRPHDTRHTCISLLAAAGVDERVIKKIVGHKGQGVTETVYTHFELAELKDAINKI